MSKAIEIVKQYNAAFEAKNIEAAREVLHPDYHFKGPMMEVSSREEMLEGMQNCPFVCSSRNSEFIQDGDKVVHIFDWDVSSPAKFSLQMVEVIELEDGKIKNSRLFFDTAKFPQEVREMMHEMMEQKEAA